jgi:chemotaxis protein methyltransferase CheR
VLPSILETNRETRRIRIWSAGCANGAEPYSIAILLHELLGSELAHWRVSIIGTDISIRAIAAARTAHFNAWTLRGMAASERQRYFTPGPKGTWILRTAYRALVSFQQQNLLALLDDSLPLQFTEFDLILCRNVLIYFQPELATRLSRAFAERLAPRRWLFLGHAEAAFVTDAEFEKVPLPGTLVYRRGDGTPTPFPAQPPWTPPQASAPPFFATPGVPAPWEALPLPPFSPSPPAAGIAPSSTRQEDILGTIRALADSGDVEAALALCRAALEHDGLSPRLHFYEGILASANGDSTTAEHALRRALYLDKHYAIAHYHLGLILMDGGRTEAGRRSFANALRLADTLPPDTLLEDGDGMNASALRLLARQHLESRLHAGTR